MRPLIALCSKWQPRSHRSILAAIEDRSGVSPKVLLPDSDSGHGSTPVVAQQSATAKLVPQGRGNYQLLGEIARGGMGIVYRAHDPALKRVVALKMILSGGQASEEARTRFRATRRATALVLVRATSSSNRMSTVS